MTTRTRRVGSFAELGIEAAAHSFDELKALEEEEARFSTTLKGLRPKEGTPEYVHAERELEGIRLRKEIFVWEHDNTGAWKGDRIGRDILERMDRMGFELGPDGRATFQEGEQSSLFIVNMGELDRLNDVSHTLGDQALTELRIRISDVVAHALGESGDRRVNVYRVGSNDFAVTLDGIDDPAIVREIKMTLESELFDLNAMRRTRGEDEIAEATDVEGVPLAVSAGISFDHARAIFNRLPKKKTGEERKFTECFLELGRVFSDFEKTRRRVIRLATKIRDTDPGAEELYSKYLKKSVGDLFRGSKDKRALEFDEFKTRLTERGALDLAREAEWESTLFQASLEESLRQFSLRSVEKQEFARVVMAYALEEFTRRVPLEHARIETDFTRVFESSPVSERLAEVRPEELTKFDELLADPHRGFGPTDGEKRIGEITGRIAELTSHENKDVVGLEHCELEKRLFLAQHDRSTGLGLRGKYFESLKRRIAENKPTSVIAIDMAFLKFFDRDGGTKTGDRAILAAGRILDATVRRARQKFGIEIEAFRKGGDEFTIVVGSSDEQTIEEIQKMIRLKSFDLGSVPTDEGGTGGYLPTELQFNFGSIRREKPLEQGKEAGDSADALDHLADGAIAGDKAINRYEILVLKYIQAKRITDPEERRKMEAYVKNLMDRSEKALLAGTEAVLTIAERLLARRSEIATTGVPVEEASRMIVKLVRDALHDQASKAETVGKAAEAELAHQFEVALLQLHVEELIQRLQSEREHSEELERIVAELRAAVGAAMGERERIVDLREKIATHRS